MSGIEMKKAALRLKMYAVHIATIDKYALGVHDSLNQGQAVFKLMREALKPKDIINIQFDELAKGDVQELKGIKEKDNNEGFKYFEIVELFFKIQEGGNVDE